MRVFTCILVCEVERVNTPGLDLPDMLPAYNSNIVMQSVAFHNYLPPLSMSQNGKKVFQKRKANHDELFKITYFEKMHEICSLFEYPDSVCMESYNLLHQFIAKTPTRRFTPHVVSTIVFVLISFASKVKGIYVPADSDAIDYLRDMGVEADKVKQLIFKYKRKVNEVVDVKNNLSLLESITYIINKHSKYSNTANEVLKLLYSKSKEKGYHIAPSNLAGLSIYISNILNGEFRSKRHITNVVNSNMTILHKVDIEIEVVFEE